MLGLHNFDSKHHETDRHPGQLKDQLPTREQG